MFWPCGRHGQGDKNGTLKYERDVSYYLWLSLLRRGSLWEIFEYSEGARGLMGRRKGREPLFSLSSSLHSPRAAVFPSPQAFDQEAFTVKAARKRPLRRRESPARV